MKVQVERQKNEVADEVSAIIAIVRPVLTSVLNALNADVVKELGGRSEVKLRMLSRTYRPGDGDCGICFEYAVHDAISNGNEIVLDRVSTALDKCKIKGSTPQSLLFGMEKQGSQQLIDTAAELLTGDSVAMSGDVGRPVKLKKHLSSIAQAFRRPNARLRLPTSISGLWRADLFIGDTGPDRWVGTSVKINPKQLEGDRGLRIGVIPSQQGRSDRIELDSKKNLVVCPLPYDGSFVETFYQAWNVVRAVLHSDMKMPSETVLHRSAERQVARMLCDRKDAKVLEVVEALAVFGQPHLLDGSARTAGIIQQRSDTDVELSTIVAPLPSLES